MKPVVGSADDSRAFNLHLVQTNGTIQDNFTPFFHQFSKGKEVYITSIPMQLHGNHLSDRTNNVRVIKYYNLQFFAFLSTNKVW
jgi:hypothetical protein